MHIVNIALVRNSKFGLRHLAPNVCMYMCVAGNRKLNQSGWIFFMHRAHKLQQMTTDS